MSDQQQTVSAFVDLQLFHLTPEGYPLIDDPLAIAREVLAYIDTLPEIVQQLFNLILDHLNGLAQERYGRAFGALSRQTGSSHRRT